MPSLASRVSGILLLLLSIATPLCAQSTEAGVAARLKGKPLYIRGFWSDDTLHFDVNGDLSKPSKRTVFTLAGFSFDSLTLRKGVLTIYGKPIGIEFLKDVPKRVDLPESDRTIDIAAPPSGDFGPALDAIFADGLGALAPTLPPYWQAWARRTYPAAYPPGPATTDTKTATPDPSAPRRVGGSVLPPRLLKHTDAQFSEVAKALLYSNYVVIDLVVGADGKASHLAVFRPAGLDLDERAMAAVAQYAFAPATENGLPVPVEVNVQVNFQIF